MTEIKKTAQKPAAGEDEAEAAAPPESVGPRVAVVFPGQGAQAKGMGRDLFPGYPEQTAKANEILRYSIEALCLEDPDQKLNLTQFTQPALYVVNALGHYRMKDEGALGHADFYAGHSLGEYNALHAAGVFDFETGLRLVVERGRLMSEASGGGMAAVVGIDAEEIGEILAAAQLDDVDLANFNTPSQTVISGPEASIDAAVKALREKRIKVVPLKVSAAFHSRYMEGAQKEFARFLSAFAFNEPERPVIANATALPYDAGAIADTLARQIASPVKWKDGIAYLLGQGEIEFVEVGSRILTRMIKEIKAAAS